MTGTQPLVSVIIPAYNVSEYIAETLQSVFAQTYGDLEVVLINDGSPDTPALEAVIAPFRDRIVYLVQQQKGVSAARNHGIAHARGEFLAFLDGDDVWYPQCLSVLMQAFTNEPALDMVWGDLRLFGVGPLVGRTVMDLNPDHRPVTLAALLEARCTPSTSATVARRQAVIDAGLFDEAFSRSEDFDLWLRLARCGRRLDFVTVEVGQHRIRETGASYDVTGMHKGLLAVLDKLARLGGFDAAAQQALETRQRLSRAEMLIVEGKACLDAGRYDEAARSLREANQYLDRPRVRWTLFGLDHAPWLTRVLVQAWALTERLRAMRRRSA